MVDTRRMFAAIAILLFVSGCGENDRRTQTSATAGFPMAVENCGREFMIEDPPKRVMTQQADGVTLIWAAGAADKIIARSNEAQRPLGPAEEAVRQVPHIAPDGVLSREVVIAQNPDLLISTYWQSEGTPPPEDLKPAGIDVLYVSGFCPAKALKPGDSLFDLIYRDIQLYGRLLGTADHADRSVADLRKRVTAIQAQGNKGNRRAAALIYNQGKIGGYGNQSMAHEQMKILGISNIFKDVDKRYFEPNIEQIIAGDPEVIILLTQRGQEEQATRGSLLRTPELTNVAAIRNNAIITINFAYSAHGILAINGLEILSRELEKLG